MKKLVTITLCIAMLATALAGCTPAQDKDTASKAPDNATASTSAEKKDEFTLPYTGEEIVYKAYGYEGLTIDPASTVQKAWKEAVGNITVQWEYVPYNDYQDKAKIYLNSGEIPDILPVENIGNVINEYGATGALLDFSKYEQYMPNLNEYLKQYPNLNYLNTKDGNRFGIIGVQPIDFSGESWFANKTVLDKNKIAVPNTFDELIQAMRDIKKADPKSIPYQSYWNLNYIMQWISMGMEAQKEIVYYDTAAKQYKSSIREADAKRKEMITLIADLYKEKLINPEVQTMSFEQEIAVLAQGNWAFTHLYTNSLEKEIFKVEPTEALLFDIQPMTAPTSPSGSKWLPIAYQHDSIPSWGLVCSADAKNPEYLAAYMDMVVSPVGRDLMNYGVEGVTYDKKDGAYVMKDGIDKVAHGIGTLYEVWMVGMGPLTRSGTHLLEDKSMQTNLKNFTDGTVKAFFPPTINKFTAEEAEEKAKIENALKTVMDETEAKFIYGQKSLDEWDSYVKQVEETASIDRLLEIYNSSEIIVREPERVFVAG